jgi:protease-4
MFSFFRLIVCSLCLLLFAGGCVQPSLKLFSDGRDPLQECVLDGSGNDKILIIPVVGIISDIPEFSLLHSKPSVLQDIVSQLDLAAQDPNVKAVILKINSPGGGVTASDILYHEIAKYKKLTGAKVVTCMMDICASGGYYMALPSDRIYAHPTTVTGSVGVIFMQPKIDGLLDKIGVDVDVSKSGKNKDMGSPFRAQTEEEKKIFQDLIDKLAQRFITLVKENRKISPEALQKISNAGVYLPDEALKLGLIDKICYLDETVMETKKLAKIKDAKIICYRRSFYPNDNIYNSTNSKFSGGKISLVDLGVFENIRNMKAGFYYIWTPASQGLD